MLSVPFVAGNYMKVEMRDCLSGRLFVILDEIRAVRVETFFHADSHLLSDFEGSCRPVFRDLIDIGKVFFGESMFHTVTDASKVAFYHLHRFLQANDFKLIDCQQETEHLMSLGAYLVSRKDFLDELKTLTIAPTLVGNWGVGKVEALYLNIQQPEKLHFRAYNMDEDVALSND
jgi:hypothetical protein